MILDPNLEKTPPLNHMLLFKYESPVDFSVTTHMLKVYNILKYFLGLEPKVRNKIYPYSRDLKRYEVPNVKDLQIVSG